MFVEIPDWFWAGFGPDAVYSIIFDAHLGFRGGMDQAYPMGWEGWNLLPGLGPTHPSRYLCGEGVCPPPDPLLLFLPGGLHPSNRIPTPQKLNRNNKQQTNIFRTNLIFILIKACHKSGMVLS